MNRWEREQYKRRFDRKAEAEQDKSNRDIANRLEEIGINLPPSDFVTLKEAADRLTMHPITKTEPISAN